MSGILMITQRVTSLFEGASSGIVVEVREKSKQLPVVISALESTSRDVPAYVELDAKKAVAKYAFVPKLDDVPYASVMEPNMVIEFYSR